MILCIRPNLKLLVSDENHSNFTYVLFILYTANKLILLAHSVHQITLMFRNFNCCTYSSGI